ncbi:MAG: amino acid permease [Bdellovibrionales bacterium RIFOXYC1_FULL_54_43]|nr:MAG: amino acid permease [Bdellovibrionales bacterium RIFOXYC1_FULL_54_43]OFZ85609.1 MAG: amino acid permease [Bdellovibrionales bacterium RIFOXYD1_FULL_55_31]
MTFSKVKRFLVGEPLSSHMVEEERISKLKALAVLSSDALSSVAYATEEILIPLAAFAAAAVAWSMPIALGIGVLLVILTVSYRQIIDAYPNGGGAYIVAKENLGTYYGLIAGAALLIDYILTVSVSVASGVENIASAFPILLPHKEALGTLIILVIALFNLRGLRESASIFALPTYIFIFSLLTLIVVGTWRVVTGEVPPAAPIIHEVYPAVPLFLILRAFSSGCAALTGIEAISNGISLFRAPSTRNAKITMAWMAGILGSFFLGVTLLAHVYGIMPHHGETAISNLARTVFGGTAMYYVMQVATAMILILAANTSYAGFPRLASLLAKDRYLPRQLASLGDRLVFSNGIAGLSFVAIGLIILFKGETHRLIPLYAVGVFLSFTLSQAGMVAHHLRERAPGWLRSLSVNFLGTVVTFIAVMVIGYTKFATGAWMVVLLIPLMVFIFTRIHSHYLGVGKELSLLGVTPPGKLEPIKHTVIVPISGIHRGVIDALRYALSISSDVRACYIAIDPEATERMKVEWQKWAREIPFVVLKSPYRSVVRPLLQYIDDVEQTTHADMMTVLIPEFVTAKWRHQILHNQTAFLIRTALMFRPRKVVTSVRYHLRET